MTKRNTKPDFSHIDAGKRAASLRRAAELIAPKPRKATKKATKKASKGR